MPAAGSQYAGQVAFVCDALVIFEGAFDRVLKFSVRFRQPPSDLVGARWRAHSYSRIGVKIDELADLKFVFGHRGHSRPRWALLDHARPLPDQVPTVRFLLRCIRVIHLRF